MSTASALSTKHVPAPRVSHNKRPVSSHVRCARTLARYGPSEGAKLKALGTPVARKGTPLSRRQCRVQASSEEENAESTSAPVSSSPPPSPSSPSTPPVDPVDLVVWGGNLPSDRRLILGALTTAGLALGGNFLGITSLLLGTNPELAKTSGLDRIVPVKGFKRCVEADEGYEFLYPAEWLVDQRIVLRNSEKAIQYLDPPSVAQQRAALRRRNIAEPTSAFGPAGSSGEENVSMIVAPITPGFSLRGTLGQPREAAQKLLDTTIAPKGSGKEASLLRASERVTNGELYYQLEYTVRTSKWYRHNIAVLASRYEMLYTLNIQAPQEKWPTMEPRFAQMADSFELSGGNPENPSML